MIVSTDEVLCLMFFQVLEVSETASDAWSTDVLASDTSEKQAERLLELDQVSLHLGFISSFIHSFQLQSVRSCYKFKTPVNCDHGDAKGVTVQSYIVINY